jgi:hypothetical protein
VLSAEDKNISEKFIMWLAGKAHKKVQQFKEARAKCQVTNTVSE